MKNMYLITAMIAFAVICPGLAPAETSSSTQPADPPDAAAMVEIVRQVSPERIDARDARAMTEYLARLNLAREALTKLHKDYPAIAARDEIRASELSILFDLSYLNQDAEMKELRASAGLVLADRNAPRSLRAMAEYHLLNADMISRARSEPASQPDGMPAWLPAEIDRRIDFARRFKEEEIARQAFGEAIMYRDQLEGYAKTRPMVDEFVAIFPEHKEVHATLLGHMAIAEYARNHDWQRVKPMVDRLLADYRDQPATPQALSAIAIERLRSDQPGGQAMIDELTVQFAGSEPVARCWRELVVMARRDNKPDQEANGLKTLAEKFAANEARAETLASLAWLTYQEKGLDAARPGLDDLRKLSADSPIVVRVHVMVAAAQIQKLGYEKSAAFVDEVITLFGKTGDGRYLAEYVEHYRKTQATQPQ